MKYSHTNVSQDAARNAGGWTTRETMDVKPRTWILRQSNEMINGAGVLAAAIFALFGSIVGYLPKLNEQLPTIAAIMLTIALVPVSIHFFIMGIRRMQREHRNGGIVKRSSSGRGSLFMISAFFIIAVFLTFTLA